MQEDLEFKMRKFANIMVAELDQVKQGVFSQKMNIDRDFPAWLKKRNEFPNNYLQHEARREFFVTVVTLIENAQLSYLLLRDHLTSESWWSERVNEISLHKRNSVLKEYAIMIKWFLMHGIFMVVEETLRAIQRAAPDIFIITGRIRTISKITEIILEITMLQQYKELFKLTRITRNTIHTNGIYLPDDKKNIEIHYAGEKFTFEYGKTLDWLNDQRAIWFIFELTKAMEEIIRNSKVADITYCPRTNL